MIRLNISACFASLLLASGCTDNTKLDAYRDAPRLENVPLSTNIRANVHEGSETVNVIAAIFSGDEKLDLIAGDVFEAHTASNSTLLDTLDQKSNAYTGNMTMASREAITVSISHKPVEARSNRWYPTDILNIDPGAGKHVGLSSVITIPADISLLGAPNNEIYTSRNETVNIMWAPAGEGELMQLFSSISCQKGDKSKSYDVSYDIGNDDGLHTISLSELIFNEDPSFIATFLDELVFGLTDINDEISDIETSNCDIHMKLIRNRIGDIDIKFDHGRAIGSTSASTKFFYRPNFSQ